MAIIKISLIVAVLVMCVGLSAAVLVRSTPSDSERVYDFAVAETRDSASWTAFGRRWTVRLELSEVMEDNTDYYHGTLEGDESAVVSFSLLPGTGLSGMIVTGGNTWWIRATPVPERGHSMNEEDLGVFMHREEAVAFDGIPNLAEPIHLDDDEPSVAEEEDVHVDTDLQEVSADETAEAASTEGESSQTETVSESNEKRAAKRWRVTTYKVAVFFDQKWALASNNPWSSQADTMGLFNDVNAIYKAAGLATFTFKYMKQISNSKTTLNDMLNYFSDTASKSISAITDTTYTNYLWLIGANVGGLAFVGTTCKGTSSAQNRKTAVAGLVNFSRLWTVKTIAHELGHNRGANHQFDNACTSTVKTNCQCSVMSYCFPAASNNPAGAVNQFSSFTINEMKTAGCY